MKNALRVILVTFALAFALGSISAAAQETPKPKTVSNYVEIPTADDEIRIVAGFALNKHAEDQGDSIKLLSIDRAEMRSASGSSFKLCLTISIESEDGQVNDMQKIKAVVHRGLKGDYSLKSWVVADCDEKK